jgi:hypothetical protein
MDKYLIIKKTEKDSGHNEHHEKVNKRQTLAEKDQYSRYIITWGIVFSEYFKQKLFLFVDLYLSPDKLARKIYLSGRFYVRVGHGFDTISVNMTPSYRYLTQSL